MKKRNLLIIIGVLIIASLVITLVILNNKNINIDLITFFILYPFFFLLEGIQLLLQQQVSYIQPL